MFSLPRTIRSPLLTLTSILAAKITAGHQVVTAITRVKFRPPDDELDDTMCDTPCVIRRDIDTTCNFRHNRIHEDSKKEVRRPHNKGPQLGFRRHEMSPNTRRTVLRRHELSFDDAR